MTYEEAIRHFKSLQKRYTTEHNGKMCEKVATAIEALEKQIPKKLIGTEEFTGGCCPNCQKYIDNVFRFDDFKFCQFCGQAIDWSDE